MNLFLAIFPLCVSSLSPSNHIFYSPLNSADYCEPCSISPMSDSNYPVIDGFTHIYSFDEPKLCDGKTSGGKKIGYFYYDLDLYKTAFTENSMLVLVHTKTMATSGYVANRGGDSSYNDRFDLTSLNVIVSLPRITDTSRGSHTGSVERVAFWPVKEDFENSGTVSHTSSFGFQAEFNGQIEGGIDAGGLYIEGGAGPTISFTFGSSTTITTSDPIYSSQMLPQTSTNINAFSYFIDYAHYGRSTYIMNTYSLYEVGYNVSNFNREGFVIRYSVNMEVGENLLAYLDNYENINYSYELRFNLGYNPTSVDYYP